MQVANPAGAGTWTRREQFGEGHPHLFNFVRAGPLRAGHARPLVCLNDAAGGLLGAAGGRWQARTAPWP